MESLYFSSALENQTQLKEPVSVYQIPLTLDSPNNMINSGSYYEALQQLLQQNLDFNNQDTSYVTHNLHPFPAKFPPQLPKKFIEHLTAPGDTVLDPMAGSGTTVVEAYISERRAIGFDIDPLALLISYVKTNIVNLDAAREHGRVIINQAAKAVETDLDILLTGLTKRWDKKTKEFVDYWFAYETQIELQALFLQIQMVSDSALRSLFELVFSSCIITKSGGVSMAFDLAHTRPHRAKVVISQSGQVLLGHEYQSDPSPRIKLLTKKLRSPLADFGKRLHQCLKSLSDLGTHEFHPSIQVGNSQSLPLDDASVDLIVTSPPYASNAIDYMRAHKFSLVWLGHDLTELGKTRKACIGGESISEFAFERMQPSVQNVINELSDTDVKKGKVLHRYYSEMQHTLSEMYRVLRPGKAAVLVVASSVMRGIDTRTQICLSDIGRSIGFVVPEFGIRRIARNRRMLPSGMKVDRSSQIQQRMHEEFVIGFYKPEQV